MNNRRTRLIADIDAVLNGKPHTTSLPATPKPFHARKRTTAECVAGILDKTQLEKQVQNVAMEIRSHFGNGSFDMSAETIDKQIWDKINEGETLEASVEMFLEEHQLNLENNPVDLSNMEVVHVWDEVSKAFVQTTTGGLDFPSSTEEKEGFFLMLENAEIESQRWLPR